MKFKRGYWLMQPNIQPLYAVEAHRVKAREDSIEILAATKHIAGRGDTMTAALNVRLFSPAEGVIGVEAVHHAGAPSLQKRPYRQKMATKWSQMQAKRRVP